MNKKFKRINRGLILGAIALVATIIYISVDYYNFSKEKPLISEQVENYIQDMLTVMPMDQPVKLMTDNSAYDRTKEVIEKYWSAQNISNSQHWYISKSDFLSYINTVYGKSSSIYDGYVESADASISSIKVSKNGPNVALITCTINLRLTASDLCDFIHMTGTDSIPEWEFTNSNLNKLKDDNTSIKIERRYECEFKMYRVNGTWKIGGANSYYMDMSNSIIED